jgi:Glycosyltransferase family 43
VPNLFWIIVEDAEETSILVRNLVNRAGLSERSVLLHAKTPDDFKLTKKVKSRNNFYYVSIINTFLSRILTGANQEVLNREMKL